MSNEVNFHIELKGNGGTKKLILNRDSGQDAGELLVSIGAEAIVVDPRKLVNVCRQALELITDDHHRLPMGHLQDGTFYLHHGPGPSKNGNQYSIPVKQQMPPTPRIPWRAGLAKGSAARDDK